MNGDICRLRGIFARTPCCTRLLCWSVFSGGEDDNFFGVVISPITSLLTGEEGAAVLAASIRGDAILVSVLSALIFPCLDRLQPSDILRRLRVIDVRKSETITGVASLQGGYHEKKVYEVLAGRLRYL